MSLNSQVVVVDRIIPTTTVVCFSCRAMASYQISASFHVGLVGSCDSCLSTDVVRCFNSFPATSRVVLWTNCSIWLNYLPFKCDTDHIVVMPALMPVAFHTSLKNHNLSISINLFISLHQCKSQVISATHHQLFSTDFQLSIFLTNIINYL